MLQQMLYNERKERVRKMVKHRDELFSIIDEVTTDEQILLLEAIQEITKKIKLEKLEMRLLK